MIDIHCIKGCSPLRDAQADHSVPPPAASAGYFSVLPRGALASLLDAFLFYRFCGSTHTRSCTARVEVELHIMSYLSESELNTVALLSNVPPLSLPRRLAHAPPPLCNVLELTQLAYGLATPAPQAARGRRRAVAAPVRCQVGQPTKAALVVPHRRDVVEELLCRAPEGGKALEDRRVRHQDTPGPLRYAVVVVAAAPVLTGLATRQHWTVFV